LNDDENAAGQSFAMLTRCDEANDRNLIDPEVETMTRVAAQQLFLRDYRWGACDLQSFTF
jgi:hypothetical protein